jgi:hypothetical protein
MTSAVEHGPVAADGPVDVALPPAADAAALVARTINTALAGERGADDFSTAFELRPVLAEDAPRPQLRWGVFVRDPGYTDGEYGDLVSYGAVVVRDGRLRYDPRGLHEPLDDAALGRLLAAAGDPATPAAVPDAASPPAGEPAGPVQLAAW